MSFTSSAPSKLFLEKKNLTFLLQKWHSPHLQEPPLRVNQSTSGHVNHCTPLAHPPIHVVNPNLCACAPIRIDCCFISFLALVCLLGTMISYYFTTIPPIATYFTCTMVFIYMRLQKKVSYLFTISFLLLSPKDTATTAKNTPWTLPKRYPS